MESKDEMMIHHFMEVEPNATIDEEEHFDNSLLSCTFASERAKQCHSQSWSSNLRRKKAKYFIFIILELFFLFMC
jgi:hypothetical protein